MSPHASELTLRRLFAGEAVAADLKAHSEACEQCKAKLRAFEEEQRRFEAAIPFERFAAGVERAARTPRQAAAPVPRRPWLGWTMAIAASLLVVAASTLLVREPAGGRNHLKGVSTVDLKVAGPAGGPQRDATRGVAEPLAPGERVEIVYSADPTRYVVAVSVDDRGEITSYPERGQSLPVTGKGHLPDAIELTGHGLEHMVVVLTADPLPVDEVKRALKLRYDEARGSLDQLGSLDVPGEQFHYSFIKP